MILLVRLCPESNRGYSDIQRYFSEPNVMTTTLHDRLLFSGKLSKYTDVQTSICKLYIIDTLLIKSIKQPIMLAIDAN